MEQEQKPCTYIIGDKTYVQRELTLGQVNQLSKVIKHIVFPDQLNPAALIFAFGDLLPKAFAVVLCEEDAIKGKSGKEIKDYLRTRDLEILASDIEWSIKMLQNIQVIEDFFGCNPTDSLFERFAGLIAKLRQKINEKETSSTPSAPSSPAET